MSWPWSQLGLPGPSGLSEVRRAYAEKLKTTHPEDDPEGFQKLHAAYQQASRIARQQKRPQRPFPPAEDTPPSRSGSGMREDDIMEIEVPPEEPHQEGQDFDFEELLQEGGEVPRRTQEEQEEGQDFDFEELLQAEEPPPRPPERERQDFDFDRLLAEGEAERAEARRRRGEERRKAQERQKAQEQARERERRRAQEWTQKREQWRRQEERDAYERERRDRFDQEQFRWQNTETILHTIDMLDSAQADRETWERFFQSELFQQARDSLDLIFGLEDFVSTKNPSQEVRLALFLAYGFDKGVSRPELGPLYQMLLGAWRAVQAEKKKERLLNLLAIPITLALIYVAAVILMSPLLIVFIALGLLAVHGLNKGWIKRGPKSLAQGRRSRIYLFCFLAGCAIAAVFLLPGLWESAQELSVAGDPRARVCRYLEQDFGVEVRPMYDPENPDERFGNVFALEGRLFLAGPDGKRDRKSGTRGYTTNLSDMMVLWALEDFAREEGIGGVDVINQNQGLASWETSGIYLYTLPFYGAGEKITALGDFLEGLLQEDWYQELPASFEVVLCGDQMEEGRLILTRWQPEDGPFDAPAVRQLYEESFAHAYCAQLLKEYELDRDFVQDGGESYTLTAGGMEELWGEPCLKLYGLRADGGVEVEYYVNTELTDICCVPAGFWENGGSQDQLDFCRTFLPNGSDRALTLRYPRIWAN